MEENYYYCPICGHKFVKLESEYNYDTADTNFKCPDCDWEGTQDDVIDLSIVVLDLYEEIDDERISLTTEDAEKVIKELETKSYDEAIKSVAKSVIDNFEEKEEEDDDDDDEMEFDDLQIYGGSYNKRTLKKNGLCIVCWPESQELFEMDGFREHSWLINDTYGLNRFGSCAYVVEEAWLTEEEK